MIKNLYKFKNYDYKVHNILTYTDISLAINKFYIDELQNSNHKFSVLFKIKTSEGIWRNISSLQTLDKSEIETLEAILKIFWSYKSDIYQGLVIDKIVFRYRFLEHDIAPSRSIFKKPTDFEKSNELLPQGYTNLPNNVLIETWGDEIIINGDNTYIVNKDNHSFFINQIDNEYYVTLKYNNKDLFNFIDTFNKSDDCKSTFIRTIGNSKLYYHKGECNFLKQSMELKYIKEKKSDTSIKDNFITMDLETRTINKVMSAIAVSIYDGYKCKSFYITDYSNSDDLLKNSLIYLLQRKYNGYRVYIHNFSRFDAAFLLKIMVKMDQCKIKRIIKKDGSIIDLEIFYNMEGSRKYSIHFRDSLLILPSKLKKLGLNFNLKIKKTIYPYAFVNNKKISLDYEGEVPSIKYFTDVEKEEYNEYYKYFKNDLWSLKKETIKYCENDVILLYQIIREFQKKIYKLFDADINNYPTLSSLSFAIYRMKYLGEYKIPIITGELYRNLKQSYTGGSVDVYKPTGNNLSRYDVNSLYPAVMYEFPSPVGKVVKFKGNILKYEDKPFGFFFVKIKTPSHLHIPILQTRIKTNKGGVRTISPLGEWTGWYFSEEIYNAKKYGYEIEIIWGYLFEKEYIFKDFVNDLYSLKKNSQKDTPDYTISKLLLNSLYGRFGMSPDKENHVIIKGEYEIGKFIVNEKIIVKDCIELDDNIELISFSKENKDEDDLGNDNISVAVAASITSYARIKMSEIKTKYCDNIYYSDTDSIDLDVKLPDKYISNELGDYKLEKKFKKIVYIAPKVYAAITEDNKQYVIIKGYKDKNVSFNKVKKLVNLNEKLKLNQEKWYVDLSGGKVITNIESYTLMATENKRKLIYENNKLVRTEPYLLENDKLI